MTAKRKYAYTTKEAYDWTQQYEKTTNYMKSLNSVKNKPKAAQSLWHFCNWAKNQPNGPADPYELLLLKNNFGETAAEKLLDHYRNTEGYLPETAKWLSIQCVRGFFRVNYRELEKQAGKMEKPESQKSRKLQSKAQRFELYKACYSPRDKALVLVTCCSAISLETLSMLQWFRFESDWTRQEVEIPHISLPGELLKGHNKGKYRGVRQETFVTPECKRALIEYRDWFSKTFNWRWKDEDHVFLSGKDNVGEPLTYHGICHLIGVLSDRAGVQFSSHDGRRIVQTNLENAGVVRNQVQKIKGRKVRGEDSPYSLHEIDKLREAYRKAVPELEFLGAGFNVEVPKQLSPEKLEKLDKLFDWLETGHLAYKP